MNMLNIALPGGNLSVKISGEPIDKFVGEHRFLSNFWTGNPFPFGKRYKAEGYYEPLIWSSAEHLFQAMKTTNPHEQMHIHHASTPAAAKRRGREVRLRTDWETFKIEAMRATLWAKFKDPKMRAKLIATGGRELIEGNTWGDTYWGVCNGTGENMLGKLLMALREEIRGPEQ